MSNSNLDVIVSGISELEDNSTENHHAAAHRGKRRENTEKSIIALWASVSECNI